MLWGVWQGLVSDELRAFWATAACAVFKVELDALFAAVTADDALKQVPLPLCHSYYALFRLNGLCHFLSCAESPFMNQ